MGRTTLTTTRGLLRTGVLLTAFLWAAAMDAQIRSAPTDPVVGRAPVVTIEIINETATGEAPASGELLRAAATAVDPDGDTITGTTYRWLRGSTVVGTNPTYLTVEDDAGQTLTVEATATTDPATTDPASGTGNATVAVSVPLTATPDETPQVLTVGQAGYRFGPFTAASGGTPPYTLEVASGSTLPNGLDIDTTTSQVTGSPAAPFPATNVTFQLKDAAGRIATPTSSVSFTGVAGVTATADTTEQILTVGQANYSFFPLTNVEGGAEPYTFEATGALPSNVTLDAGTGEVSGIPTTARAAGDVTFRVKDANGAYSTTSATVKFSVNARMTAAAVTTARTLNKDVLIPPVNPGALDVLNTLSGGTKPWTCDVSSGTLPEGVTVDVTASTCRLNGTPTEQRATAPVTFRVRDANGVYASTTSTVNITVNGSAPVASDLEITGESIVGSQLQAKYTYDDADNDPEGTGTGTGDTSIDWCRTVDNQCNLAGNFKSRTYTIQAGDAGKQIYFKLVPRSTTGTPSAGATYTSPNFPATGTVVAALTATPDETAQVVTVGQTAYRFSPFTAVSGGTPPYTLEVASGSTLPNGLDIDTTTNQVTGSPAVPFPATNVTFQFKDAAGRIATPTSTVSFSVNARLTATAVTTARTLSRGVLIPASNPGALDVLNNLAGGTGDRTCEVTSGTLPAGVTVDATATTCRLNGTPTEQRAAAPVTFSVRDANGVYATTTSTVNIGVNGSAPVVKDGPGGITITGVPMVGQQLTANYVYQDADGDPEGDTVIQWCRPSVTCSTGLTGGTITLTASHVGWKLEVAITPKSTTGTPNTGTITYSTQKVDVLAALSATANNAAQELTVGQASYSFTPLTVSGGRSPYTYEIQSGTLPEGLTYTAGVVSGVPTTAQTASSVTFQVKDANGVYATTTSTVSFTIVGFVATANVAVQRVPQYTPDYSFAPFTSVSGGQPPYTYTRVSGTLPTGLAFGADGKVISSPMPMWLEAARDVEFEVRDTAGNFARHTVNFGIVEALMPMGGANIQTLFIGQTGYSYRPLYNVTGGEPPYTFDIFSGTLPSGLNYNGDVVSGIPDQVTAARTITFRVRDSGGQEIRHAVSFTVNPMTATANTTIQELTVGQTGYSFTPLTPMHGLQPYVLEVQSGTLPAGLRIEGAAVVGSPTATRAPANVVFRIKDATGQYATETSSVSYAVYSILSGQETYLNHLGHDVAGTPKSASFTAYGSGNASSSAKFVIMWKVWSGNWSTDHVRLYLVGPTGTRTLLGQCNTTSSAWERCEKTVNLSAHPKAGTWRIEGETVVNPGTWAFNRLEITF